MNPRALPPATLILWQGLGTIPTELLEAAAIDGAGPITRLVRFALPNRLAALALAWLVALAVASGDLAASILVVPPGMEMLSRRIFGLIHYGIEDQVAGILPGPGGPFRRHRRGGGMAGPPPARRKRNEPRMKHG